MTTPLNHFVTEGNVDIYLSKLHETFDADARDNLLRLLVAEESRMAQTRAHLENGERRVAEGLERILRQREELARLEQAGLPTSIATFLLETLQHTQRLLEDHCRRLRETFERHRL